MFTGFSACPLQDTYEFQQTMLSSESESFHTSSNTSKNPLKDLRALSSQHVRSSSAHGSLKNIKSESLNTPSTADKGKIPIRHQSSMRPSQPHQPQISVEHRIPDRRKSDDQINIFERTKISENLAESLPIYSNQIFGQIGTTKPQTDMSNGINFDSVKFGIRDKPNIEKFISNNPDAQILRDTYGLTNHEAIAIVAYTHDYYEPIRLQIEALPPDADLSDPESLINSGVKKRDLAVLISDMFNGLKKLPPSDIDSSHSKALGRSLNLTDADLAKYKEGNLIDMPSFTSTTISGASLLGGDFWNAKTYALMIRQARNGNGRDISALSLYPNEKEICYLPRTKFKVIGVFQPKMSPPGPSGSRDLSTPENQYKNRKTKPIILLQEMPLLPSAPAPSSIANGANEEMQTAPLSSQANVQQSVSGALQEEYWDGATFDSIMSEWERLR